MINTQPNTRAAQYSGSFYPADPEVLQLQVASLLNHPAATGYGQIKALVVPHAGYDYSGEVAGLAYATLAQQPHPRRIALFGPCHKAPLQGAALCSFDAWTSPLGDVPIDHDFIRHHWARLPQVSVDNALHQEEYSLEVQLPFIQRCLPGIPIAPVLLGQCHELLIGQLLQATLEDPDTLIVISSDLYHYLPRQQAIQSGMETVRLLEQQQFNKLTFERACGYVALRSLTRLTEQYSGFWQPLLVRHSAQDNRFNSAHLVGYGAFLLRTPHHLSRDDSS